MGIVVKIWPPEDNDIIIKAFGWDKQEYYMRIAREALMRGEDSIIMPNADYEEALKKAAELKAQEDRLHRTASRNNKGIALEKAGLEDEAISVYEENIAEGYPALHAFERLMIIYRRHKDYRNEIRVIERAVEIFSAENRRRANRAVEEEPQLKDRINRAVVSCEKVMGSHGFYCYVPYDVVSICDRLHKAETLLFKQIERRDK